MTREESIKRLMYILVALDVTTFDAAMAVLRTGGMGGPTTMLSFLLKLPPTNKKTVV
jgi:hypothetical protein